MHLQAEKAASVSSQVKVISKPTAVGDPDLPPKHPQAQESQFQSKLPPGFLFKKYTLIGERYSCLNSAELLQVDVRDGGLVRLLERM